MPVRHREHFNQAHRILCKKGIIRQRQPAPVELETVQLLRPPRDAWQKTAPACGKGIIKVRQKNAGNIADRSEEHTSELQSLMRISYAVFCLKKKNNNTTHNKARTHL